MSFALRLTLLVALVVGAVVVLALRQSGELEQGYRETLAAYQQEGTLPRRYEPREPGSELLPLAGRLSDEIERLAALGPTDFDSFLSPTKPGEVAILIDTARDLTARGPVLDATVALLADPAIRRALATDTSLEVSVARVSPAARLPLALVAEALWAELNEDPDRSIERLAAAFEVLELCARRRHEDFVVFADSWSNALLVTQQIARSGGVDAQRLFLALSPSLERASRWDRVEDALLFELALGKGADLIPGPLSDGALGARRRPRDWERARVQLEVVAAAARSAALPIEDAAQPQRNAWGHLEVPYDGRGRPHAALVDIECIGHRMRRASALARVALGFAASRAAFGSWPDELPEASAAQVGVVTLFGGGVPHDPVTSRAFVFHRPTHLACEDHPRLPGYLSSVEAGELYSWGFE